MCSEPAGTAALADPDTTVGAAGQGHLSVRAPTSRPCRADAVAGTGLKVHIGGETAGAIDFTDVLGSRLPIFIGAVLALSFLLLLLVFRRSSCR